MRRKGEAPPVNLRAKSRVNYCKSKRASLDWEYVSAVRLSPAGLRMRYSGPCGVWGWARRGAGVWALLWCLRAGRGGAASDFAMLRASPVMGCLLRSRSFMTGLVVHVSEFVSSNFTLCD